MIEFHFHLGRGVLHCLCHWRRLDAEARHLQGGRGERALLVGTRVRHSEQGRRRRSREERVRDLHGGRLLDEGRHRRLRRRRDKGGACATLGHKRGDQVAGDSEHGIDEGVGGRARARVFPSALQGLPQRIDNRIYINRLGQVVAVELNQIPDALALCLDLLDDGLRPTTDSEAHARARRTGLGDDRSRPGRHGLLLPLPVVGLSADPDAGLAPDSDFQCLVRVLRRDLNIVLGAA